MNIDILNYILIISIINPAQKITNDLKTQLQNNLLQMAQGHKCGIINIFIFNYNLISIDFCLFSDIYFWQAYTNLTPFKGQTMAELLLLVANGKLWPAKYAMAMYAPLISLKVGHVKCMEVYVRIFIPWHKL